MTDDTAAREMIARADVTARWDAASIVRDEDRKVADAILSALTAAGFHLLRWQDISEAPKDGTHVWTMGPGEEFEHPLIAYHEGNQAVGYWWEPSESLISDVIGKCKPTHFALLPPPPPPPEPAR